MPLLAALHERFVRERPFEGLGIAACLHITAETAMLVRLLRAGGAAVSLAASNPLSTQDDIAAALAVRYEVAVFARAGVDRRGYYRHIELALNEPPQGPDLVIDDGGDLVNTLHTRAAALLPGVRGGCESTTTGVIRLRRMAAEGALAFPVIAANDTATKRMVDNTCGTGQSAIDGILRATNTLLAGKTVVVAGFGASGRGVAERARGFGAQVIVTEVDPVRALDASLRGFRVLPMAQAAPLGEVFVTATGSVDVIHADHLAVMRDGAILANAGHFDVEIDVRALTKLAVSVHRDVRPHVDAYELGDGRTLLLLAEGRVVNLVAAEGHPAEVMDLAFGIEALALAWLARTVLAGHKDKLPAGVHEVPADIDAEAASLVLATTGTSIDALTPAQLSYLASWRIGSLSRGSGQARLSGLRRDGDGCGAWGRRPGQDHPSDQPDRVDEVPPPGGRRQREHHREPERETPGHGPPVGRRPDDERDGEAEPGRDQQADRDPVARHSGHGQQVPGQRAGRRRLVAGQAQREEHGVLQERVRVQQRRRRQRHGQRAGHQDREPDEAPGGPGAIPGGHRRGEHRDRGPGGRLHRARDPEGHGRAEQPRRAGDQRQGKEHQRDDRRVGDADRQRERDHRGRGEEDGGQGGVVPARVAAPVRRRDRERRPDQRDGYGGEPQPGIGEQAGRAQRPRQAEHRHDRQVRVVGQPGVQLSLRQVRGAVLQQQHRRPRDDLHLRRGRHPGDEPGHGRGQRPGQGDQHRPDDRHVLVPGQPDEEGRHSVADRCPDGPGAVGVTSVDRQRGGVDGECPVRGQEPVPAQPVPVG